eukprot:scaffold276507_cov35-Tisochrysis_lutea.AAC.1
MPLGGVPEMRGGDSPVYPPKCGYSCSCSFISNWGKGQAKKTGPQVAPSSLYCVRFASAASYGPCVHTHTRCAIAAAHMLQ